MVLIGVIVRILSGCAAGMMRRNGVWNVGSLLELIIIVPFDIPFLLVETENVVEMFPTISEPSPTEGLFTQLRPTKIN